MGSRATDLVVSEQHGAKALEATETETGEGKRSWLSGVGDAVASYLRSLMRDQYSFLEEKEIS